MEEGANPNPGFGDRTLHSADIYAQAYCNDDDVGDQEITFQGTVTARGLLG